MGAAMRLTLRTLLAYMDDILDPADQEELGRKIEASPFATELIHRSRDAVRRLRLSASDPLAGSDDDIHGGDHNLDANTAAEYLDNTLSPEAVADFERSCLEAGPNADMLLAEAASCHHVLTMVLGEPAEVDADLRQRMYALAQSPAAAKQAPIELADVAQTLAAAAAPPAATVPPATTTRRPQVDADEAAVPDYMLAAARQRRRARRRAIGAALVAAIVCGGLTWYFWPREPVKVAQDVQVGEPATSGTTAATADAQEAGEPGEAPPFIPGATTEITEPQPQAPTTGDAAETLAPTEESPETTTPPPATPTESSPAPPAKTGDAAATAADEGTEQTAPDSAAPPVEAESPPAEAPPTEVTPATPTADPGVTAATASVPQDVPGTGPMPAATAAVPAPPTITAATPPLADGGPVAVPSGADAGEPAAATAAERKPIGAYLGSNDDLLLQFDEAAGWVRLPPRSAFMGGEQLLSLPTFRTHIVLAEINAFLAGGTQVDVIKPAAGSAAELALHIPFGRVVFNSGLNGNTVELSLVDQTRVVQMGPSSSLAIEVRRVFVPGGGANREPAPAEVTWYLTSGSAQWGDEGSAEAPTTWTTIAGDESAPGPIEKLPDWIDREPITDIERRARDTVAEALAPGEPVNIQLLELSDEKGRGRRTEVRALAARCGAYVGQYDPLVRALGDVNQRASWKSHIEALRQAIARDPAAVEGIREAFAIERGQEAADDLVEMLLGFDRAAVGTTPKEVQEGALVRLLRWMDHDDLTYRILASYNVNEITGTRDLGGYQPQHASQQRARSLRHYWERFENGELMPRERAVSSR